MSQLNYFYLKYYLLLQTFRSIYMRSLLLLLQQLMIKIVQNLQSHIDRKNLFVIIHNFGLALK